MKKSKGEVIAVQEDFVLMASCSEMFNLLTDLLKDGNRVRIKVRGYSMRPFLWNRKEVVELSYPNEAELVPKTLVVFYYCDRMLVHRILERKDNSLTLMGDGVFNAQEKITVGEVIGIVRKIVYPGGYQLDTHSSWWRISSEAGLLLKPLLLRIGKLYKRNIILQT